MPVPRCILQIRVPIIVVLWLASGQRLDTQSADYGEAWILVLWHELLMTNLIKEHRNSIETIMQKICDIFAFAKKTDSGHIPLVSNAYRG